MNNVQMVANDPRAAIVEFELQNITDRVVEIFGVRSSCTCIFPINTPLSLEPGQTANLELKIDSPCSAPGSLTFTSELFLSLPSPPQQMQINVNCVAGTASQVSTDVPLAPVPDSAFVK
jgi:hypothetical protein